MPLNNQEIKDLITAAIEVEGNAFIFKSKHTFGAAVMTWEGKIYGGCNIDGVISNMGSCAEVTAMNHAVAHGQYQFKALAVVDEKEFVFPCGVCLQYLSQFYQTSSRDIAIISAKENGDYKIKMLSELLPEKYLSNSFKETLKTFINKTSAGQNK